jgi:hypothetical protein
MRSGVADATNDTLIFHQTKCHQAAVGNTERGTLPQRHTEQGQGSAGIPESCGSGLLVASAAALAARFRCRRRRRFLRLDNDHAAAVAFPSTAPPRSAANTSEPGPVAASATARRRRRRRFFAAARLVGGGPIRIWRPEEAQKWKGSGVGGGVWAQVRAHGSW